jgi:hypothetical protein
VKAEIAALAALPPTADVVKQQPTGRTIRQVFAELYRDGSATTSRAPGAGPTVPLPATRADVAGNVSAYADLLAKLR